MESKKTCHLRFWKKKLIFFSKNKVLVIINKNETLKMRDIVQYEDGNKG